MKGMFFMENDKETFESFITSFFYGSRSDLSFKFMSDLSTQSASEFLQHLFKDIIDGIDSNDITILKKRMLQGQIQGYKEQKNFNYDQGPFLNVEKPLSALKVTLLTSSGHFVKGDDPTPLGMADMTQEDAERRIFEFLKEAPTLSEIPFQTDPGNLRVRHGGYDIRGAKKDPNVSFPYQRMVELKTNGLFADLSACAYSFVGACSQKRLLKQILPEWVNKFQELAVDAVVLVPV
jgi:hypothetical protein